MTCCGFKNDFCKKSGGLLFSAKVQNHTDSSKIGRNLRKIQKYLRRLPQQKGANMRILGGLLFMCGVFPIFQFGVLEQHFSWDEMEISLRGVPRHLKGHACV
jgi:hypothetical protein